MQESHANWCEWLITLNVWLCRIARESGGLRFTFTNARVNNLTLKLLQFAAFVYFRMRCQTDDLRSQISLIRLLTHMHSDGIRNKENTWASSGEPIVAAGYWWVLSIFGWILGQKLSVCGCVEIRTHVGTISCKRCHGWFQMVTSRSHQL